MTVFENPILPGFHPDPSICRVGDDYYLANSTFQWWPGIKLSHSRDLVHWKTVGYALTRPEQLDLRGVDDSMGVWAPTLRHYDGRFYQIASIIRQYDFESRTRMSIENRLYTAPDIAGPWDDGAYIHDTGIDPDLFQDLDGTLYVVCQDTKTGGGPRAERISIQRYDPERKCVTGPLTPIWDGTELAITEGPHIYHRDGYYYLLTAEGGTFFGHAVSLCRSRNILGPYELTPGNPILTMVGRDEEYARSGHADLVQTQNGEWWMVCLGGRPNANRRCTLGRETFLLPVRWTEDGWLEVNGGRGLTTNITAPDLPPHPFTVENQGFLGPEWQVVRTFEPRHIRRERDSLHLRARPEPLEDISAVNVIGRRQQHKRFAAEVMLDFAPDADDERAGLACYYDRRHFLSFTLGCEGGRILELKRRDGDDIAVMRIPFEGATVRLRVEADDEEYRFFYREGSEWQPAGGPQDGSMLSDEAAGVVYPWAAFTGAFVCLFATGNDARSDKWATFTDFQYVG